MKIIINLPKSAAALASMFLADDMEQGKIDAAIQRCEEQPTEIDMAELSKQTGTSNSDMQAFNLGLALIAIGKAVEELKKEEDHPEYEK